MIWAIAIGLVIVFLYTMGLDKRISAVESHSSKQVPEDEDAAGPLELCISLKTNALFKHPEYASYYERALEKFKQDPNLWEKTDHPLVRHSVFRLIYLKEGVLWSDAQKTFIEEFDYRGKLISLDEHGQPNDDREPILSLRMDDGMLQLHWICDEFLKMRATLISQFPLYVFQSAGELGFPVGMCTSEQRELAELIEAARKKHDHARMFELMVGEISRYGFKWSFSDRDASIDLFGKEYVYDPNDGYLAFADAWMDVKYKEWSLSGMDLEPNTQEKHSVILERFGKVEVWDGFV